MQGFRCLVTSYGLFRDSGISKSVWYVFSGEKKKTYINIGCVFWFKAEFIYSLNNKNMAHEAFIMA